MNVIYSNTPYLNEDKSVIRRLNSSSMFLAGPTPRSARTKSWRPEALEILEKLKFSGDVCVPEWSSGKVKVTYTDQVEWEKYHLTNVGAIVFWVPRKMHNMLGLTTNVEFGYWLGKAPMRIVYGRPDGAPHTRYLDWLYERDAGMPVYSSLESLLQAAVSQLELKVPKKKEGN